MNLTFRSEAFTFSDEHELAFAIQVYLKGMSENLTDEVVVDYQIAYTTFEEEGKRMYSAIVIARYGKAEGFMN